MEAMKMCRRGSECQMWVWLLMAAVLVTMSTCSPIMVYEGTRMAPIEPPLPVPRMLAPYPPIPPAPVWENPEPELNSVYRRPPPRYGFRLKPLLKSYTYPYNGYSKTYGYKTI